MNTIVVCHWVPRKSIAEKTGYEHNIVFEHSIEKRNEIVNNILACNYEVMVRKLGFDEYIYIDDMRFRQR